MSYASMTSKIKRCLLLYPTIFERKCKWLVIYCYQIVCQSSRGFFFKPLSHQTAMPQRLHSVLKSCQRAVGSPRNTPKISNLSVIGCTQRPHSVPTASTRRSHSVFTASMTFSQRASSCCSVFTARTWCAHSVLTALTQRPNGDYSV